MNISARAGVSVHQKQILLLRLLRFTADLSDEGYIK